MDINKAWEVFASTGKVEDYLKFKSAENALHSPDKTINTDNNAIKKDKDRRTDNKTTEYW